MAYWVLDVTAVKKIENSSKTGQSSRKLGQVSENEHGGTRTKTEISKVNHSNIVDDYKYQNIVTNIGDINGGNIAIKSA